MTDRNRELVPDDRSLVREQALCAQVCWEGVGTPVPNAGILPKFYAFEQKRFVLSLLRVCSLGLGKRASERASERERERERERQTDRQTDRQTERNKNYYNTIESGRRTSRTGPVLGITNSKQTNKKTRKTPPPHPHPPNNNNKCKHNKANSKENED